MFDAKLKLVGTELVGGELDCDRPTDRPTFQPLSSISLQDTWKEKKTVLMIKEEEVIIHSEIYKCTNYCACAIALWEKSLLWNSIMLFGEKIKIKEISIAWRYWSPCGMDIYFLVKVSLRIKSYEIYISTEVCFVRVRFILNGDIRRIRRIFHGVAVLALIC